VVRSCEGLLACVKVLVSMHRHDYRECGCPQGTLVDGGSAYLRRGGKDLAMVEVLVNPEWPANVSLPLLQCAERLAVELNCVFDPPARASADDVARVINWMESALALAERIDVRVRDWVTPDNGPWKEQPQARYRR
jgi:hypothetical protein